ncbi:efflux RND transporter periplasmic adaptor subunit [Dyadobacter sp. NIV53]|uniref:efflux RND transporter periplasmic adaptor subunit n=1 Tax=Dyadobacter sp. NIV53 TaxID=2861765 RepID=UPI001C882382|nr:efflux RND transporter periplasmic adaptor subunit [Dyadobacter sp. NIV53]
MIKIRISLILNLALFSLIVSCKKEESTEREKIPSNVRIMQVGKESKTGTNINYSGIISASKTIDLSFQVAGTILRIPVESGQFVKKGQLIAEVDETVYRDQYNAQLAQAQLAEDTYRRILEVFKKGSIAEIKMVEARSNFEQAGAVAKATYQNIAHTKLYAPQSGYIANKLIEAGATSGPGVPVVRLIDITSIQVHVAVPETEINQFKKGDKAIVKISALENEQMQGMVEEASLSAAPGNPTYIVKVALQNKDNRLKPGMVCDVTFPVKKDHQISVNPAQNSEIIVPVQSVQIDEQGKHFVYVTSQEGNKAIRKEVQTGGLYDDGIAVKTGLGRDEQLIVYGYHKLTDGSAIKIIK